MLGMGMADYKLEPRTPLRLTQINPEVVRGSYTGKDIFALEAGNRRHE
jgi:hypothetical protein